MQPDRHVQVNGIGYRWPQRPVVAVCIDGGDPAYLSRYLAEGAIPNIAQCVREGFAAVADGSMPSFTCPNNMSIITGTPTAVHGISGNFYLDTRTWEPVVMTGPELLRADTVLAKFAEAGARVVSITAKDKLRRQLAKGLDVSAGMCRSPRSSLTAAPLTRTASSRCRNGSASRFPACIRWNSRCSCLTPASVCWPSVVLT